MNKIYSGVRVALCALSIAAPISGYADSPISGNIRVVIGSSSTGGDTYQATSIIADALSEKLGANFKVDAVGVTGAFRALDRVSNGSTIMVFHDQAYLGHLYEQKGYEDPFEKYTVGQTFAINPGSAYLVAKNSPYQNVQDVIDAAGNGTTVRVAIQPGGVSEIGYTALKNAVRLQYPGMEDNLAPLNTGSQSDKNQAMFDGLADVINGSVQANEQYTRLPADDQKAMRFLWLTAREGTVKQANPEGMGGTSRDELMKYVAPMVKVPMDETADFTFDKEFFFLYNKDTDPKIIAAMDVALEQIFAEGKVQETMKKSFFIPDFLPANESQEYLKNKRDQYAKIIQSLKK